VRTGSPGATCPRCSASGAASFAASVAGVIRVCGGAFFGDVG
jgi:hypothetical protein